MIRSSLGPAARAWGPAWNVAAKTDAFRYFRQFEPIKTIGHSIYVYHLSADDVAGAAPLFMARDRMPAELHTERAESSHRLASRRKPAPGRRHGSVRR